jgi:hypothetical protein
MKKRIIFLGIAVAFSLVLKAYAADEYWQSLDGPYWVNGVDVAYGNGHQTRDWHRYLIGNNGSETNLFHWWPEHTGWQTDNPISGNKIICYKLDGYGQIAFLSAYGDKIWRTTNGGANWFPVLHSENLPNKHFSSIEVPFTYDDPGNVVMVAALGQANTPSTYYTTDGGQRWDEIGNNTTGLDVYDLAPFAVGPRFPPPMSIGTPTGIYIKGRDNEEVWGDGWKKAAFNENPTYHVPVVETIMQEFDGPKQFAAVETGEDGRCDLYYSGGGGSDPNYWWASPKRVLIGPNGYRFNKRVKDISATSWTNGYVSLYVATDEGLFFLKLNINDQTPDIIASEADLSSTPFAYDTDIQALDGRYVSMQFTPADTFYTLVSTMYGIYEICETRISPSENSDPLVTDITSGTYYLGGNRPRLPHERHNNKTASVEP